MADSRALNILRRFGTGVTGAIGFSSIGHLASVPAFKHLTREIYKKPYPKWEESATQLAKAIGAEDVPIETDAGFGPAFYVRRGEHAGPGAIAIGKGMPAAVLAHEMGHAARHKERSGFGRKWAIPAMQLLQSLSLFGALGGAVLGRKVPGRLAKVLARRPGALKRISRALSHKAAPYVGGTAGGLGAGYAMNYPLLSEEWGATERGLAGMKKVLGEEPTAKGKERLQKAYNTYRLAALIQSLAGTAPGLLA